MKIAIIGIGFLGKKLKDFLSKKTNVIAANIIPIGEIIKLDAADKSAVNKFLLEYKPDIVIDTVALTSSIACEKDPKLCERLNHLTAKNIADICKKINAQMIFISSSYVFDGKKGNYTETDPVFPTNEYAKTKIRAENEVLSLPNSMVIRVDLMYGVENNQIKCGAMTIDGKKIEVGYPNQIRSPIFIDDIPFIIFKLIQENKTGIFHIAQQDKIKMLDFLKELVKVSNLNEEIKIVDSSNWIVKSPENSSLNPSKINLLGLKATPLKESLIKIKEEISQKMDQSS